jgi:threonine dehydrogenase-like Zn-dependent dehydrogenase
MNTIANLAEKKLGDLPTSTTNNPDTRSGQTMRACAWQGKENLKMIDVPIPVVTDPCDAVIRVTGSTVCGSDLHLYHGEIMQLQKGDILGHEFMGVIEEVGSNVTQFKPGQRVVSSFNIACGTCDYCKKQLYTSCCTTNNSHLMKKLYGHKIAGVFGYSHFLGGFAGGQAEYVRIPFADTNLFAIPDGVPDERALYLSDIVPTSYHAVVQCDPQPTDTVGIWGLGPIGLLVAQWLKVKGVKRIIGIDNVQERMDLAFDKFGVICINFDEVDDVAEHILKHFSEGLDRAIDCAAFRYGKSTLHKVQRAVGLETDTPEILNEAIRSVKKFGTISIIADYCGTTNGFMIGAVMEKGIRLIGCGQAPVQKYIPECLGYIERGEFDPTLILTHRFELEAVPEVYKRFDLKDSGIMKVFVQTKFSSPPASGTPQLMQLDKDTNLQSRVQKA